MQEMIQSYHNAGFIAIPLRGKIPLAKGWQDAVYDLDLDLSKFKSNFGLVLQDDQLVIDVDPRNFKPGDNPLKRLSEDFGLDPTKCVVVRTGGGGNHIYFRKPMDCQVRETLDAYPGIEFKSKGRQVVGAGSIHPDTGDPYELKKGSFSNIPDAPEALLRTIRAGAPKGKADHSDRKFTDNPRDIERFLSYCETADPAIEGQHGDLQTYKVACEGKNLGLNPETTLNLMFSSYSPRCEPSWSYEDLKVKVTSAYKYGLGAVGEKTPEADFEALPRIPQAARFQKIKGTTVNAKTIGNVVIVLQMLDCVVFNEFSGQVEKSRVLPWEPKGTRAGGQWSDGDSIELKYYMDTDPIIKMSVSTKLVDEAVYKAAKFKPIHPIQDYLKALKWDGIPRLDKWLIDYLGCEDTAYVREVGKNALLQAVARIFRPGCKADHVLILEGAQGIGKSTAVQILGGEYYADIVIDPHSRDTVDAMRGAWFLEFSEMEVTRRADAEALKSFVTRTTDRCRLAYGKRSIDYPRQCVFVGTINPNAMGEYLVDATGNRRMWPVLVQKVALDLLRRDRNELFAEAYSRFKAGEVSWIENKHVLQEALIEQEKRRSSDPWVDVIDDYIQTDEVASKYGFVMAKDLWLYALKGSESQFQRVHAHRIGDCLRSLGWEYGVHRHPVKKQSIRCFRKTIDPLTLRAEEDLFL
jgi:predicted P-loop ATPase